MVREPTTDIAFEANPSMPAEATLGAHPVPSPGSWRVALRRLAGRRLAMAALAAFLLIGVASLAAPLYSDWAGVGPTTNNLTGRFERGGRKLYVVTPPPDSRPVGPGWSRRYLLGADKNGRDEAVRLLYGGRNSLFIGLASALITIVAAVTLGLAAGYRRGWVDAVIRTVFDFLWSFPALLLGIALGTALAIGGLHLGPVSLASDSLWIPTLIIGVLFVPYVGRPIRGQALALRQTGFAEAAIAQGLSPVRIMIGEILPNLASTIVVFVPLVVATNLLTEAALSFLGVGVQPPDPSWGNMVGEGVDLLEVAPHLTIVPGLAITLTVLALNLFGDGVRDALDPSGAARAGR